MSYEFTRKKIADEARERKVRSVFFWVRYALVLAGGVAVGTLVYLGLDSWAFIFTSLFLGFLLLTGVLKP